MSTSSVPPPHMDRGSFEQFPKLPLELQDMIWLASMNSAEPRLVRVDLLEVSDAVPPRCIPTKWRLPPAPSLMHACSRSRIYLGRHNDGYKKLLLRPKAHPPGIGYTTAHVWFNVHTDVLSQRFFVLTDMDALAADPPSPAGAFWDSWAFRPLFDAEGSFTGVVAPVFDYYLGKDLSDDPRILDPSSIRHMHFDITVFPDGHLIKHGYLRGEIHITAKFVYDHLRKYSRPNLSITISIDKCDWQRPAGAPPLNLRLIPHNGEYRICPWEVRHVHHGRTLSVSKLIILLSEFNREACDYTYGGLCGPRYGMGRAGEVFSNGGLDRKRLLGLGSDNDNDAGSGLFSHAVSN